MITRNIEDVTCVIKEMSLFIHMYNMSVKYICTVFEMQTCVCIQKKLFYTLDYALISACKKVLHCSQFVRFCLTIQQDMTKVFFNYHISYTNVNIQDGEIVVMIT